MTTLVRACMAFVCLFAFRMQALGQGTTALDIQYQQYVLDNGLTLIVHEDHKAPVVAVNIWYHVGSKNEPTGKTGFAHLFEHLMFNGSEHLEGEQLQALEGIGATSLNGTTWFDRTNYFETIPVSALDYTLWLEADRMGYLLDAIDQEKLDEQRGVVQNEKRQGENEPYGRVYDTAAETMFPEDHPYEHPTIGSMADLDSASLSDVKEWFKTYYGPNNATLVIAGDVHAPDVRAKVEQYFGDIPPTPPLARMETWIPRWTGTRRQSMQDRVPQARIYMGWNVPEWGSAGYDYLNLTADILAGSKTSRLYDRLVVRDGLATDVSAFLFPLEISGMLFIQASAKPGIELSQIEQAIDEELDKLIAGGPTADELERVKTSEYGGFVRDLQRVGGFGGKSDYLAQGAVYADDPSHYKVMQQRMQQATVQDVQGAAHNWLSDSRYVLDVTPFPELAPDSTGLDRSQPPAVAAPPTATLPPIEQMTLSNGTKVVLAHRPGVPLVTLSLAVDAGFAADASAAPGTASLTLDMLDEGTATRSSEEISKTLQRLGANLSTRSSLDMSFVDFSVLKKNLDPALELLSDVVLHPSFPEQDFKRLQQQQLAGIEQEQAQAFPSIGLRLLPALVYGSESAYGTPLTGSGTTESVSQLTLQDLQHFHATWFKPNNTTVIAVGDVTMAELKPLLERAFGDWERGRVPEKNLPPASPRQQPAVYLVDKPGAEQTVIYAANLVPSSDIPNEIAIETLNNILGGTKFARGNLTSFYFGSRLNLNLREDKHWSYGAFSMILPARGQRIFTVMAPVQTDKTKEAVQEVAQELNGILGPRPITQEELQGAAAQQTLTLAGQWETQSAILNSLADMVEFGLSDQYFITYPSKVRALSVQDVQEAAPDVVHPNQTVWLIVGDLSKVEQGIRDLNLGEVHILSPSGKPLSASK